MTLSQSEQRLLEAFRRWRPDVQPTLLHFLEVWGAYQEREAAKKRAAEAQAK